MKLVNLVINCISTIFAYLTLHSTFAFPRQIHSAPPESAEEVVLMKVRNYLTLKVSFERITDAEKVAYEFIEAILDAMNAISEFTRDQSVDYPPEILEQNDSVSATGKPSLSEKQESLELPILGELIQTLD